MPKRFRLTRRCPVAMTEHGNRRLKRFFKEVGLGLGEVLSLLFEYFNSVIDKDNFAFRLWIYNSGLEAHKK